MSGVDSTTRNRGMSMIFLIQMPKTSLPMPLNGQNSGKTFYACIQDDSITTKNSVVTNIDVSNERSDCYVCSSGRYQDEKGRTSCKLCPAGTFRPVVGGSNGDNSRWISPWVNSIVADSKSDCIICNSGQYQNVLGSTSVKNAKWDDTGHTHTLMEKYFDENDVNFNGLASDSINDCAICSAGKYMNSMGATECTLCDQGLILIDNGAVQAEHQSKSKCRVCSSGKFLYDFYDLSGPFHVKVWRNSPSSNQILIFQ